MTPENAQVLQVAGVDFVPLATNHALDFDLVGIMETQAALDKVGIMHAGTGQNRARALKPATLRRRGVDMQFFSFADYGNGFGRDGRDVQTATAVRGGLNYLNTHGIRRQMPFAAWDVNFDTIIDALDVEALRKASEETGDVDLDDFEEIVAFMDTGVQGIGAQDGAVTVKEYNAAMAGVTAGTRYDPGWVAHVDALAAEVVAARTTDDELLIVSVHWGGNWAPVQKLGTGFTSSSWSPDPGVRYVAHKLIDAGVDIIHGGSSHHLLGHDQMKVAPFFCTLTPCHVPKFPYETSGEKNAM